MSATVETPGPPVRPASYTADVMCDKAVQLRDKVAEIKKRHAVELSKYNLAIDTLEGWMMGFLNDSGANSMKTESGTFFKTMRTSVVCNDWPATLEFIQQNEAWDLLEARVSKTAATAIVEETKAPIPGVAFNQEAILNVRRA